jgi:peptidyl-prolyl cis-trans isomerase D
MGGVSAGILNSPKMLTALFSDDVLKNKRNSEAIEVAPNKLVSARLLDYKPATVQALAAVSDKITNLLVQQQTRAVALKQGEQILSELRTGKESAGLKWSAFQLITRAHAEVVTPKLVEPIFAADEKAMPNYVGSVDVDGNYQLVRVTRVLQSNPPDDIKLRAMQTQLANVVAQQAFADYLASLTKSAKIEIAKSALEKTAP